MKRIAVQVADEQKADLLVELLSALTFIDDIQVEESNGVTSKSDAARSYPTLLADTQSNVVLLSVVQQNQVLQKYTGERNLQ